MLYNNEKRAETKLSSSENNDKVLKPYQKPLLEELDDLRTLTLGGTTISPGDSGTDPNYYWP